jgi:hypothetical protein
MFTYRYNYNKFLVIFLLFFVFVSTLFASSVKVKQNANTYFVSIHGNNKNSGKTTSEAFRTIQHAIELAKGGTRILILKGEYYEDLSTVRSGSKDNPIKIIGAEGSILKGKKKAYVFQINHSYIELSNLTIDGKVGSGSKKGDFRDKLVYIKGRKGLGVTGVKLLGLKLQNALGECVRIKYFASNNEIAYNHIQHCGIRDFVFKRGKKNGEAIYIGTAPKQVREGKNPTKDIDHSNENWIHDNVIATYANECVDIKEGSHHNILENNICTGQLDPKSGGFSIRGNNNIIRNNIIYDNKGAGIRIGGHKSTDGINNKIYNNHISNNKNGALKIMVDVNKNKICGNQIFVAKKQKKVRTIGNQKFIFKSCEE